MEWIDGLAETLAQEPLSGEETATLLATARSVAHRVERRVTPLSAFLLGCAVGQGLQDGTATRPELVREAVTQLTALLPDGPASGTG
ncbi:MAG TPA: DUF6457 domain-containing protein [Actinomycetota bacterium]|jgi:hypothetical protein|nr:DUF6457 domain-containing protein [Actinomycetota bacterium]